MQFTKAEEYGVLGVLHLAEKGQTAITPLSEVSEAKQIPEKFLAKIFQSLSRSGIVRSHRGVRGGFALARSPEEITVREILESIQGPYHLMKCVADLGSCERNGEVCALRELLIQAEQKLKEVFDNNSLADLARWEAERKNGSKPVENTPPTE